MARGKLVPSLNRRREMCAEEGHRPGKLEDRTFFICEERRRYTCQWCGETYETTHPYEYVWGINGKA